MLARAIIARVSRITVTHFTDPGCPFAYTASPALAVLRWRYGDQLELAARHDRPGRGPETLRRGGLHAHAYDDRQPAAFAGYGMPLLMEPRARVAATSRACRAIVATRLLFPGREDEVLRALQLGWFTTTLLLDEDADIAAALERVDGLDVDRGRRRDRRAADDRRLRGRQAADPQRGRRADDFQGKARQTDGPVRYSAPSLVFHGRRRAASRGGRLSADRGLRRADRQPRPHARAQGRRRTSRWRRCDASPTASSRRRSRRSWRRTTSCPIAPPPRRALIELTGDGRRRRDAARRRRALAHRLSRSRRAGGRVASSAAMSVTVTLPDGKAAGAGRRRHRR